MITLDKNSSTRKQHCSTTVKVYILSKNKHTHGQMASAHVTLPDNKIQAIPHTCLHLLMCRRWFLNLHQIVIKTRSPRYLCPALCLPINLNLTFYGFLISSGMGQTDGQGATILLL